MDLYICIKEVKTRFTLFNASERPFRPYTNGVRGREPCLQFGLYVRHLAEMPIGRRFSVFRTACLQKIQKKQPQNAGRGKMLRHGNTN